MLAAPPVAEAEENQSQGMGQAHVGDYKVQSHTGSEFTHDELFGDFGLVYFGTSSHPDTVSELERLAEVISNSGAPLSAACRRPGVTGLRGSAGAARGQQPAFKPSMRACAGHAGAATQAADSTAQPPSPPPDAPARLPQTG